MSDLDDDDRHTSSVNCTGSVADEMKSMGYQCPELIFGFLKSRGTDLPRRGASNGVFLEVPHGRSSQMRRVWQGHQLV